MAEPTASLVGRAARRRNRPPRPSIEELQAICDELAASETREGELWVYSSERLGGEALRLAGRFTFRPGRKGQVLAEQVVGLQSISFTITAGAPDVR